jgi:hypothetical protein
VFYFLSFISATAQYKTGTTSMETTLMAIPPKDGIAIGTIMSDPLPLDVSKLYKRYLRTKLPKV